MTTLRVTMRFGEGKIVSEAHRCLKGKRRLTALPPLVGEDETHIGEKMQGTKEDNERGEKQKRKERNGKERGGNAMEVKPRKCEETNRD